MFPFLFTALYFFVEGIEEVDVSRASFDVLTGVCSLAGVAVAATLTGSVVC